MRKNLLLAFLLPLLACAGVSQQERQKGKIHLDIAQESLSNGDPRTALAEVERSVKADPENPEARHLYGLILHVYFAQTERAVEQYRKAIDLRPNYSEAKVNLGAALTSLGRCADAVPYLEQARQDLLYREPWLAENNLGWCRYLLGDVEGGILHLRAAVSSNPGFCLGWRNLAEIAEKQGKLDEALGFLERYGKSCPTVADADYRRAQVLRAQGREADARAAFAACASKAEGSELAETCQRLLERGPEG